MHLLYLAPGSTSATIQYTGTSTLIGYEDGLELNYLTLAPTESNYQSAISKKNQVFPMLHGFFTLP